MFLVKKKKYYENINQKRSVYIHTKQNYNNGKLNSLRKLQSQIRVEIIKLVEENLCKLRLSKELLGYKKYKP